MNKLKELRRLERATILAAKEHADAELTLRKFKESYPEVVVGQCFVGPLSALHQDGLIAQARADANWLASKCVERGSGAACDSGEARIVVLLEELCTRLEGR